MSEERMNREVEQYLKKATRGLWGRKRQEIREELSAHIQGRVTAYRIAGLDETGAIEKTLSELGHPNEVSSGMTRLHTLPTALNLGTLAAVACAVMVTFVSGSMAQNLQVSPTFPSPACLATPDAEVSPWGDCQAFFDVWTSFEALQEVLEPQGVEVKKSYNMLSFKFSDGRFAGAVLEDYGWLDQDGNDLAEEFQPKPGYFGIWELLGKFASGSTLPVSIEGWDNPVVQLGNASFVLGNDETPVDGREFYLNYLDSVVSDNQFLANSSLKDDIVFYGGLDSDNPVTLQVNAAIPDTVYGVVAPTPSERFEEAKVYQESDTLDLESDLGLALEVAQPDVDGTLTFHLPVTDQFVTFLNEFSGEPQIGTAVLVRLTGKSKPGDFTFGFDYEVVPPEQISVVN